MLTLIGILTIPLVMSKRKIQPANFGEYLNKTVIPLSGMTRAKFAEELGISRPQLYNLIGNKRRLTFEVASKLGEITGKGSAFWLRLELDHRLHVHRAAESR